MKIETKSMMFLDECFDSLNKHVARYIKELEKDYDNVKLTNTEFKVTTDDGCDYIYKDMSFEVWNNKKKIDRRKKS